MFLKTTLEKLDIDNKIATISGVEYSYCKLINTMPLNHFVEYLPSQMNIKDALSCNKVLVFNLGFDKPSINPSIHWTYIPMKHVNFYRCGFYNNILGDEKLSMYIEIGFKENDDVDINEQLECTLINLKKLGIITDHNLIAYNSLIINPGYVHITEESIESVSKLKEKLREMDIYTIGRYGEWTYCSIEDCMRSAIKCATEQ